MLKKLTIIFIQIAILCVGSLLLALAINVIRSEGIPLIMPFPPEYQCPSIVNEGEPVEAKEAIKVFGRPDIIFVDARRKRNFDEGHIKGAIHIRYSFIEPIEDETVKLLKRYSTIIVYCNYQSSERSKLMAGELAAAGVKGVVYLQGGLYEWVKQGGEVEGVAPQAHEELLE